MSKIEGLACPECHSVNDGALEVDGKEILPEDGDVSVCAYCGTVGIFVLDVEKPHVRFPTRIEKVTLDKDPRIARVQKAILADSTRRP